jgi:hypothetical protein
MSKDTRYWFPAKRYGWGWGLPATWEGWLVLLAYGASLVMSARRLMPQEPARFGLVAAITTAVLIVICYMKGEPPSWRWGNNN